MRFTGVLHSIGEHSKKWSNLPDSYIKRMIDKVDWKQPKGLQYRKIEPKKRKLNFGLERPWTDEFAKRQETPRAKVFLEPIKDWSFFRGDRVEILVGKDAGKQGYVNMIIQERNWITVPGLHVKYSYVGKTGDFPGMLQKVSKPLLVNREVALVDPFDNKPTEVEWRYREDGSKVRVSKRTGREIPIPKTHEETYDYKTKAQYPESEKDTVEADLTKITFVPKLKTFEMDLMDEMGIEEDRIPRKTFWY